MRFALHLIVLLFCSTQMAGQSITSDTSALPRPQVFEAAFSTDSMLTIPGVFAKFSVKDFGKIKVQTGKITLSSFEEIGKTLAFRQTFPKGTFPIQLAMGEEYPDFKFLAYARILFSKNRVAKWKYALRPNEFEKAFTDYIPAACLFGETEYAMFVVGDSVSHRHFRTRANLLTRDTVKQRFNYFDHREVVAHKFTQGSASLAAFKGDWRPCYTAYIGYDSGGKICRLLIDPGNYTLSPSFF